MNKQRQEKHVLQGLEWNEDEEKKKGWTTCEFHHERCWLLNHYRLKTGAHACKNDSLKGTRKLKMGQYFFSRKKCYQSVKIFLLQNLSKPDSDVIL